MTMRAALLLLIPLTLMLSPMDVAGQHKTRRAASETSSPMHRLWLETRTEWSRYRKMRPAVLAKQLPASACVAPPSPEAQAFLLAFTRTLTKHRRWARMFYCAGLSAHRPEWTVRVPDAQAKALALQTGQQSLEYRYASPLAQCISRRDVEQCEALNLDESLAQRLWALFGMHCATRVCPFTDEADRSRATDYLLYMLHRTVWRAP